MPGVLNRTTLAIGLLDEDDLKDRLVAEYSSDALEAVKRDAVAGRRFADVGAARAERARNLLLRHAGFTDHARQLHLQLLDDALLQRLHAHLHCSSCQVGSTS